MTVDQAVAALESGAEFELPGIPGVAFVDLAHPAVPPADAEVLLDELASVHKSFFPDYGHVPPEWRAEIEGRPADPQTEVHLWLARHRGKPAGEVILHVNRRRGVVLVHFVAMAPDVRRALPRDWLVALGDGFEAAGVVYSDAPTLVGVAGEVPAEHVHKWRPAGFAPLDVGYVEPFDGRHWRETGNGDLRHTTPILRLTSVGSGRAYGDVAAAAIRGFAVDYYGMDPESELCTAMLRRAAGLSGAA